MLALPPPPLLLSPLLLLLPLLSVPLTPSPGSHMALVCNMPNVVQQCIANRQPIPPNVVRLRPSRATPQRAPTRVRATENAGRDHH